MSAERLRYRAWLLLLLGLELFKKGDHRMRIIPGGPHILSAEPVCLLFGAARELEEGQRNHQSGRLPNRETANPAEEDQRDRAVVNQVGLRRLLDAMSGRNVPGLVRYHTRQLRLVVGGLEHAAVDVEMAARQRKGVDLVRVNHLDRDRRLDVRVEDDILPHAVDKLGDNRVSDELRFPIDLGGELAAESDLLVDRVEIYLAFVDVPLADHQRVVFVIQRLLLRLS